jgi:LmbE family N-acetylglucosaminyl deacetylase
MSLPVVLIIIGLTVLSGLFLAWMYGRWPFIKMEERCASADVKALPEAPPFVGTDRVLFFSPHPDDESLAIGGSIARAVAAGAEVHICWMCSGDGFLLDALLLRIKDQIGGEHTPEMCVDLGRKRLQEALSAGNTLGVHHERLTLMGYADDTLLQMFTTPDVVVTSPFTKRSTGPYSNALSFEEDYTGANTLRHVRELIDTVKPTIVYATAPVDTDTDHQATGGFVMKALESIGQLAILRSYVVHGGDYGVKEIMEYPIPRGLHKEMALSPPPINSGYSWIKTSLDEQTVNTKYAAIQCHASQVEIMQGYMQSFVRTNELYTHLDLAQATLPK